ncbi:hypothetical protein K7X08_025548 [Anisodus acutangulus]|uniref:protein disulfide-isomerase n=1 Tax=Anisodus acutangulus TaxID=402998 RepID=A0A9Q1LV46_9SOLA|nr:hypothetical protein K7X08_025548 [Anisodus acutangulus]
MTSHHPKRSPHGLAYESSVAFSPEAYSFFHPENQQQNTTTSESLCDNNNNTSESSGCSRFPTASSVKSNLARESLSPPGEEGDRRMGAGGMIVVALGFGDAIVTWIKKIGPGIYNITTTEDAECVLTSGNKIVLGFVDSLVGPETEQLAAASKLEDDLNFYQTTNPNVTKLFHIEESAKRPALVLLKKEEEKMVHYDGQFTKSAIAKFVSANKLPLVTTFTRESGPSIFKSPIKKQVLLFATTNDTDKVFPTFQEAAKLFKGKNEGDVKIVVGNNFDDILLDDSKDVLL